MIIFANNLKRLYRDKFTFVTMLILPIIFISFSMFAIGGSRPLVAAVIDYDNTEFTSLISKDLGKVAEIVEVTESELKQLLINGRLDYAVKLEKGFTEDLLRGADVKLQTYSLKETNTSAPVKYFMESYMNAAKNIAAAAKGDEDSFYRGFEQYRGDAVAAHYRSIEGTERDTKSNTYVSLGFLIMFMMYMSISAATLVLEDKQLKTYSRILTGPISTRSYFVQNVLSAIAVMLLQVLAIFAIMRFIFKADMGPAIGSLLVLFAVFALTAVALGVAISSFSKNLMQANAASYLITIPLCMLGGCFWPREIMPRLLQQLSNFTPVTWVLKAIEKLLYGSNLSAVYAEIGILLLFALVFFIAGSNKKIMMKG